MGTETTPSSNKVCPEPARPGMTDPRTMINLTFPVHLLVPSDLCPTFSLYDPERIFSTVGACLWDVSPLSSRWWPLWNKSFYFFHHQPFLRLRILLVASGWTWSVRDPVSGALAFAPWLQLLRLSIPFQSTIWRHLSKTSNWARCFYGTL